MKTQFTISAFALIRDDKNRILLCLRNDNDLWNLPGGTLEHGEAPWECVIREVKEETGLDVEIIKLACVYNKEGKNAIGFDFECNIIGGKFTLSNESKDIKWFLKDEIPKNIVLRQIERINDFLENNKEIRLKTLKEKSLK